MYKNVIEAFCITVKKLKQLKCPSVRMDICTEVYLHNAGSGIE